MQRQITGQYLMSKFLKIFLLICVLSILPKAPWPQGTECVAKYNFKGTSEHDLSFKKGDVLTIIVVTKVMLHHGGDFMRHSTYNRVCANIHVKFHNSGPKLVQSEKCRRLRGNHSR